MSLVQYGFVSFFRVQQGMCGLPHIFVYMVALLKVLLTFSQAPLVKSVFKRIIYCRIQRIYTYLTQKYNWES